MMQMNNMMGEQYNQTMAQHQHLMMMQQKEWETSQDSLKLQ
jgi:hypothetical protein